VALPPRSDGCNARVGKRRGGTDELERRNGMGPAAESER
jgi:hypothetical protein